jgi:hypothetical protein
VAEIVRSGDLSAARRIHGDRVQIGPIEVRYQQRRLHSRQVFQCSPAFHLGVRFALAVTLSVESSGRSCGHRRETDLEVAFR